MQVLIPETHSIEHSGRFEPPGTRLHKLQSPQDSVQSNDEKESQESIASSDNSENSEKSESILEKK